jgi:hypothetical protein
MPTIKIASDKAEICAALDQFGLPRAVVDSDRDAFIGWNTRFLQISGFSGSDLAIMRASDFLTILPKQKRHPPKRAFPAICPVRMRHATNPEWLTGYAVLDDDGIKYLMFDLEPAPTSDFGPSGATNSEEERNRLLKIWHDDIGPKILAAIFAAENVKLALESEGSPQAQAVRHCCELLSESVEALNRMLSGKLLSAEDRSDALTFRDTKSPN